MLVTHQAGLQQLNEQYELVLKCLKDTEATNKRLLEQVNDRNKLYTDSKVSIEDHVICITSSLWLCPCGQVIREELNKLEDHNKSLHVKLQVSPSLHYGCNVSSNLITMLFVQVHYIMCWSLQI